MERTAALVEEVFDGETLVSLTFSDPQSSDPEGCRSVQVKPVLLRGARMYQFACRRERQETHRNLPPAEAKARVLALLAGPFRQAVFQTTGADIQVTVDRKGRASVRTRPASRAPAGLRHDRTRRYLLPEGEPCEFLRRLGVMTAEGRVVAARRDKFRQVNRFLEMVADVAGALDGLAHARVVDFGCGKGYLTFALYHYLRFVRGLDAEVVGLDLKADVVAHCGEVARDLGFEGLRFEVGDIRGYDGVDRADIVVALHACDTATDDALARAVRWGARVIMAAPCCQHELFSRIHSEVMRPMLKHGIVRERLAALVTDSMRASLLETAGYSVQLMEFIETEHTPKNLLIRAVRHDRAADRDRPAREYRAFREFWGAGPRLEAALEDPDGAPDRPGPAGGARGDGNAERPPEGGRKRGAERNRTAE